MATAGKRGVNLRQLPAVAGKQLAGKIKMGNSLPCREDLFKV